MTSRRRMLLSAFFAVVLLGHAREIVAQTEHWPFSNYAMYAEVTADHFSRKKVVGVLADGREIELEVNLALSPFDNTRLTSVLKRIREQRGREAFERALQELFARYEMLRATGQYHGPPIVALRVYEERFKIVSGATNRDHPQRKLVFEAKRGTP